jgi:hypothetical protein
MNMAELLEYMDKYGGVLKEKHTIENLDILSEEVIKQELISVPYKLLEKELVRANVLEDLAKENKNIQIMSDNISISEEILKLPNQAMREIHTRLKANSEKVYKEKEATIIYLTKIKNVLEAHRDYYDRIYNAIKKIYSERLQLLAADSKVQEMMR